MKGKIEKRPYDVPKEYIIRVLFHIILQINYLTMNK